MEWNVFFSHLIERKATHLIECAAQKRSDRHLRDSIDVNEEHRAFFLSPCWINPFRADRLEKDKHACLLLAPTVRVLSHRSLHTWFATNEHSPSKDHVLGWRMTNVERRRAVDETDPVRLCRVEWLSFAQESSRCRRSLGRDSRKPHDSNRFRRSSHIDSPEKGRPVVVCSTRCWFDDRSHRYARWSLHRPSSTSSESLRVHGLNHRFALAEDRSSLPWRLSSSCLSCQLLICLFSRQTSDGWALCSDREGRFTNAKDHRTNDADARLKECLTSVDEIITQLTTIEVEIRQLKSESESERERGEGERAQNG